MLTWLGVIWIIGRFSGSEMSMGTWLSLFNNWETVIGQGIALVLVVGSYVLAQYLRVWRPRRRGAKPARVASELPAQPADLAVAPITRTQVLPVA